jgi:hypothetical protein
MSKMTHLYGPAARCKPKMMIWRRRSCASVFGLLMEPSAPGHHGYPRALDLIRVSAPKALWVT